MKFNSDLCINKYIAKETCLPKEKKRKKENKPKCKTCKPDLSSSNCINKFIKKKKKTKTEKENLLKSIERMYNYKEINEKPYTNQYTKQKHKYTNVHRCICN